MKKCPKCGCKSSYSEKYDSYFCKKCKIGLENKCSDPNCEYCSIRPDKPTNDLKGF